MSKNYEFMRKISLEIDEKYLRIDGKVLQGMNEWCKMGPFVQIVLPTFEH